MVIGKWKTGKLIASISVFAPKSESDYRRIIFLISFLFYLICLAPTVLWGDEAAYQTDAFLLRLAPTPDSHPIFLLLAHPFTYLPFGDIAYRVNLVSAFFSALTLSVVFSLTSHYTESLHSRLFATAILCISHTFWEYSVRAAPYSLTALVFTLTWFLILKWNETGRLRWLLYSCFIFLFGSMHHLLIIIAVPGFLIIAWPSLNRIKRCYMIGCSLAVVITLMSLCFIIPETNKFITRTFNIMWPIIWPPKLKMLTMVQGVGLLIYNLQISILFSIVGLKCLWKTSRISAIGIIAIILSDFFFIVFLNYPPAYTYYLLIVVALSILCAPGIAFMMNRMRALSYTVMIVIVIICPVLTYHFTPTIMHKLNLHLPEVRDLPGRDAEKFYLWPPKTGNYGARLYGESALNAVPDNSLILADGTTGKTLWYLQNVDGLRKDVSVVIDIPFELQAAYLRIQSETHNIFIADTQLYYNMDDISKYFSIRPIGSIYSLKPYN